MKISYPEYYPEFYTATIYEWKHLLLADTHKAVIINSLQFMVSDKRIILNAFVIMSNHIHLIWQPVFGFTPSTIQDPEDYYYSSAKFYYKGIDDFNMLTHYSGN